MDIHQLTANALGITRREAKNINFYLAYSYMPPEPRSEIDFDITPGAIFKAVRTLSASPRGRVALRALAELHKPGGILNLDLANAAAWRVLTCAGPGDFNGTVVDAVTEAVATLPID